MITENHAKNGVSHARRNRIISGLILILLGGLFLLDQFVQIPRWGISSCPGWESSSCFGAS
ncbi:MAG TPA: hypothetical protein VI451_02280 [Anaerolineales bacterium]|nr:hypothetical protein [Anaerolineales bacterium]